MFPLKLETERIGVFHSYISILVGEDISLFWDYSPIRDLLIAFVQKWIGSHTPCFFPFWYYVYIVSHLTGVFTDMVEDHPITLEFDPCPAELLQLYLSSFEAEITNAIPSFK